jgi:hypothetical protein
MVGGSFFVFRYAIHIRLIKPMTSAALIRIIKLDAKKVRIKEAGSFNP